VIAICVAIYHRTQIVAILLFLLVIATCAAIYHRAQVLVTALLTHQ